MKPPTQGHMVIPFIMDIIVQLDITDYVLMFFYFFMLYMFRESLSPIFRSVRALCFNNLSILVVSCNTILVMHCLKVNLTFKQCMIRIKNTNIKCRENSFSGSRVVACRQLS
jgi:hypothetical protein